MISRNGSHYALVRVASARAPIGRAGTFLTSAGVLARPPSLHAIYGHHSNVANALIQLTHARAPNRSIDATGTLADNGVRLAALLVRITRHELVVAVSSRKKESEQDATR